MSRRGSFSRSVARAAASGGGKAYRAQRPNGFYVLIVLIVAGGIGLVVYSRQERLNAGAAAAASSAPGKTANWQTALAFDICGKIQPALAANTNLSTAGLRTFGDGLVNIDPGAVSKPANFEGSKANLATFVSNYAGLDIAPSTLRLPGKNQKTWQNGDSCTTADGPAAGKGEVEIEQWASPTAKGALVAVDPSKIRFENGLMLTVAFVPKGTKIPEPPSKAALLVALGRSTVTTTTNASATSTTIGVSPATGATGAASTSSTAATTTTTAVTTTTTKATTTTAPTSTTSKSSTPTT